VIELAEIVAAWPLVASMALAVAAQGLRAGRRRGALNEALHELRRPLQALALASAPGGSARGEVESSVQLAAVALERLDREVNGRSLPLPPEPIELRALLDSAVRRWRSRTRLGGGSLDLRWRAGRAVVVGDRADLAQALDNLIVNAIEHGGPTISVEARLRDGRVQVVVADSGSASRPRARRDAPGQVIARLSGRRRHGHGLAVVRRVAAAHGGRFFLRRSERGTLALLELPLAGDPPDLAA
jgi:signal transduction histidine kinase